MRFGLIGFSQGFYATTYTRHLAKLKGVEVVVCCDLGKPPEYVEECAGVTAEAFTAELGCALVSDVDSFFAHGLDAVMIASEVWEHAAHTELALERGCHAFVGKPLSFKPDEVERVMAKSRAAGRLVLPGNPLRYEGALRQMAKRVRAGDIGKPINVRVLINHEAMLRPQWETDPRKSGGPLGTFGIYLIDSARWLTGHEFASLYATGGQFVFDEIGTWDTVQAMGTTTEGALVQLNLVSTVTWDYPFIMAEVVGTKGTVHTDHFRYAYVMQNPQTQLGPIRYDAMGQHEIEHFIACCRGAAEPAITLEDMLEAAKGIEAIERSLLTGQVQHVGRSGETG